MSRPRRGSLGFRGTVASLSIIAGVALGFVLGEVQASQHESQDTERMAMQVVNGLRVIDGLEWRAMAGEDPAELRERVNSAAEELASGVGGLGGNDNRGALDVSIDSYVAAVRALFTALEAGDLEEAEEIDEGRVDPAFEEAIRLASDTAEAEAEAARNDAELETILTWVATAGAGVLLGAALWFLVAGHEQREAAKTAAEMDKRFRSLVESSKDVFTIVSGIDELSVMSDDPGILGSISEASSPITVSVLLPDDQYKIWLTADERVRTDRRPQGIELRVTLHGGAIGYLEAHGSMLDEQGSDRAWVWRDISERKVLELQLAHQAFHDSLTGVANRTLLQDRADHALSLAARSGNPVSVLFCDLDDFKTVNDSLGHGKGDELLNIVTARLNGCVRDSDTLARLGGDEFALLLEDADTEMARALAERILDVVGYEVSINGRVIFPSVSIGVATSIPGTTTEELLRNADTAMYVAKRAGKGRVEVFENGMHDVSASLLGLQTELKTALEASQLRLHFQPTVRLADGVVEGVEALVRWEHPTRGMIPPDVFIPVAEATGTIVAIGRWVLSQACRSAVQLQDPSRPPLLMQVNVSPQQLRDPALPASVKEALEESGLEPALLVLEVTEGTLLDDQSAIQRLHELKALGLRIAIDDFGTGYTSINYLQQLPIDILKIDRSFVSGGALPEDQRGAFLHAIVGLANSLGVHSIAEGIERHDQLNELKLLGCDSGQGFLWSAAVDQANLESMMIRIGGVFGERPIENSLSP